LGVNNILSLKKSQRKTELELAKLFNLDEEHVNALSRDYEMAA
jgi:hypothetical protein